LPDVHDLTSAFEKIKPKLGGFTKGAHSYLDSVDFRFESALGLGSDHDGHQHPVNFR